MIPSALRAWSARLGLLGLAFAAAATSAQGQIDTYVVAPVETSYTTTSYLVPSLYATTYTPTTASTLLPTSYVSTGYVVRRPSLLGSLFRPTSYYVPTTYVAPTSYAVPTSYVVPTTYAVPTSYSVASTAAVLPTVRYVSPTSYLVPTVYDSGLVTTSYSDCNEAPAFTAPAAASPTSAQKSAALKSSPKATTRPDPESRPAPAPQPRDEPVIVGPGAEEPAAPGPLPEPSGSPPAPDFPEIPPGPNQSMRPVPSSWGILSGQVLDTKGRPIERVKLTVRSKTAKFEDQEGVTNAFGQFAISLPEGDWEVVMPMDGGKVVTKAITVSGGEITTDSGRVRVPSLVFYR